MTTESAASIGVASIGVSRQQIRLRNDLYCVGWGVKLTHSLQTTKKLRCPAHIYVQEIVKFSTYAVSKDHKILLCLLCVVSNFGSFVEYTVYW